MSSPEALERQFTLATAVARYDELRSRDVLCGTGDGLGDEEPGRPQGVTFEDALELLALGEVIARKAGYGRQLDVRSARAAGASWTQIGVALGTSKQSAWESHSRWIDGQAALHAHSGIAGMDEAEASAARALSGKIDQRSGP